MLDMFNALFMEDQNSMQQQKNHSNAKMLKNYIKWLQEKNNDYMGGVRSCRSRMPLSSARSRGRSTNHLDPGINPGIQMDCSMIHTHIPSRN